jgi:hypothetical protein
MVASERREGKGEGEGKRIGELISKHIHPLAQTERGERGRERAEGGHERRQWLVLEMGQNNQRW